LKMHFWGSSEYAVGVTGLVSLGSGFAEYKDFEPHTLTQSIPIVYCVILVNS